MRSTFSQQLQTFVLIFIVGILCVSMLGAFNNQLEGCASGGSTFAVRVYGDDLTQRDFDAVYRLGDFNRRSLEQQQGSDLRRAVANGLVDRTLLVREAEELGMQVDGDELMRRFVREGVIRMTMGIDAPRFEPRGAFGVGGGRELRIRNFFLDEDDNYDVDRAENYIRNYLGLSIGEFKIWQGDEELAHRVRQLVIAGVDVSPAEVWAQFEREKERASVSYFRFSPGHYRTTLEVTEEGLTQWMASNAEQVDREYQENISRYTGLPAQVRARHILFRAAASASEDDKAAARAQAETALRRARAGEDFEALARELSEDSTASRGGDLGFNERGRMVRPFDEAQFSLEPGDISDVIETQFGYHVIQVVAKREGDVPVDEAKREIAERLYRESRAEELARTEAARVLRDLRGGTSAETVDRVLQGLPAEPPTTVDEEGNTVPVEEEIPERPALAPALRTAEGFDRTSTPIRGLDSAPLARAVFEMEDGQTLPAEPLRLGTEYVVFQVTDRQHAERDEFTDEVQTRLRDGLRNAKQREALRIHIMELRAAAEAANAIAIRESLLRYGDDDDTDSSSDESSSEGSSSGSDS